MVLTRVLDSVSSRLAFFPPSPPSYSLARHGDGAGELYVKPQNEGARAIPGAKVHRLPTGKGGVGGDVIVAAYIPSPGPPTRFTVLHSHGNAVDLGQMLPVYSHLARLLKVNVMGYDYRGYGQSEGEPAASNTLRDISVVLDCLCQEYQRQLSDVVIMGQSVGTGPTSWLAARTPGLAGVVLHSAYLSGLRVLKPGLTWWPAALDIYPNFKHVPKIECKTLIMHGTDDNVIGIEHGRKLHALCKNAAQPFWGLGRNHDNLELDPEYLPALKKFLKECFGPDYRG